MEMVEGEDDTINLTILMTNALAINCKLELKSTASPTDALMFCNNKAFLNFLEDDSLRTEQKSDWVDLILATLNQALQADDTMSEYRETLKLALVPQNPCHFLNTTCTFRLMDGFNSSQHHGINIEKLIKSFENYLNIFHHLCSMDPLMSKALLADIQRLKQYLRGVVMDFPQLHSVSELYNQATSKVEKAEQQRLEEERAMRIGHRTRRYMTEKKPEGNFREMSLHPTEQDLKAIVNLRVNKVKGAFDGVEDYLDVQFRLLREDFVSTLRTGIRDYRDNPHLTGDHRFRSGDVKAYENFTITSPNFGRNGITYVVSINKEDKMFRRINWASSKRLLFGSLLCLSTDCFTKNILFATIAERDVKVMEKDGVFEIQFLADSQQKYDMMENQAGPFVAVESMAYFEAYSHVLNGIQKINENNFALSKYIVEARTTVSRPEYLKRQDVKYRFITTGDMLTEPTSLHDVSQYMFQDSFSMYNSRNASTWPTANNPWVQ
ncbi:ZNFX1 [Bugula neritina]|uniref:ZNFX1 n=1 Tax=Bugula neritina TaxID=10212 RepID=A0A7J7KAY1_BUGNE|nr:ZNFX1 [Bugula neritina]